MNKDDHYIINGEDVICRNDFFGAAVLSEARTAAKEISSSEDHSWAYLWYIQGRRMMRDVFCKGRCLSTEEIQNYHIA